MKINKKQLKTWIKALDSGKYNKGKYCLNPSKNRYCCLGVGCKVLIPADEIAYNTKGYIGGFCPGTQHSAPKWFKVINEDFHIKTGILLSELNDSYGFKFSEIATLLELVYIHEILK